MNKREKRVFLVLVVVIVMSFASVSCATPAVVEQQNSAVSEAETSEVVTEVAEAVDSASSKDSADPLVDKLINNCQKSSLEVVYLTVEDEERHTSAYIVRPMSAECNLPAMYCIAHKQWADFAMAGSGSCWPLSGEIMIQD